MYVVATAGHVDHGKSTLMEALTGTHPDRLAEERRRGLTIDLGFTWTSLPGAGEIAFVDVPGHERFLTTMLAGVGSVPAVLFVVAADEGWMPQSAEHLEVLEALGVRHGLVCVTKTDRADPDLAVEEARIALTETNLENAPTIAVSAATGAGLDDLRRALVDLVTELPAPDPGADVRLWVDRWFVVRGAGTVVTGTLAAGSVGVGDELVDPAGRVLRVRGLEALGERKVHVEATARVALNLRGGDTAAITRGTPLVTPDTWRNTDVVDVAVHLTASNNRIPDHLVLHLGTAAVPCHVRMLGAGHARLRFDRALPLRYGDRAVLRDPGRQLVVGGATVLDVAPPRLFRRGSARTRAAELADTATAGDVSSLLLTRGPRRRSELMAMGLPPVGKPRAGDWYVDPTWWAAKAAELHTTVARWQKEHPLEAGMPIVAAAHRLGLPDPALALTLARNTTLHQRGGLLAATGHDNLPPEVEHAVRELERSLAESPFAAPPVPRLTELGLGASQLAAAERAGRLLRVAPGIVLLPDVEHRAHELLTTLPQPFTLSEARQAMQTTRRVALPLLERLAAHDRTRRTPDGRHQTVSGPG